MARATRYYTTQIMEAADEGMISWQAVAEMCLMYMSESDVEDMLAANDVNLDDELNDDDK